MQHRDERLQWCVAWLFYAMHPDPFAVLPKVDVELRTRDMLTADGRAYKVTDNSYKIRMFRHLPDDRFFRVLAHEVRHIVQYATGRLTYTAQGSVWLGKTYSKKLPWEERPWEKEAVASEFLGDEVLKAWQCMLAASNSTVRGETFLRY